MLGVRVDLDEDAVSARREAGQGERRHDRPDAGGVARVDEDRKVRALPHEGHAVQVERVPRGALEGADAALAEDDLVVTARMYSAAESHSSTVAPPPRFNSTGRPARPAARSSAKFCMFRAPICSTSA